MCKSYIPDSFTKKVELILNNIPYGKITSYGTIAALAGSPKAARQVVQIIKKTENIPWHRVVNSKFEIAIKDPVGFQEQKILLAIEGTKTDLYGKIDRDIYVWRIQSIEELL